MDSFSAVELSSSSILVQRNHRLLTQIAHRRESLDKFCTVEQIDKTLSQPQSSFSSHGFLIGKG